jgi:hypothetical protein
MGAMSCSVCNRTPGGTEGRIVVGARPALHAWTPCGTLNCSVAGRAPPPCARSPRGADCAVEGITAGVTVIDVSRYGGPPVDGIARPGGSARPAEPRQRSRTRRRSAAKTAVVDSRRTCPHGADREWPTGLTRGRHPSHRQSTPDVVRRSVVAGEDAGEQSEDTGRTAGRSNVADTNRAAFAKE